MGEAKIRQLHGLQNGAVLLQRNFTVILDSIQQKALEQIAVFYGAPSSGQYLQHLVNNGIQMAHLHMAQAIAVTEFMSQGFTAFR